MPAPRKARTMTPKDVTEIKIALARIQERQTANSDKMDVVKETLVNIGTIIKDHAALDTNLFAEITTRLGKVENKQWWLSGVFAAAGTIIGAVAEATFGHKISAG